MELSPHLCLPPQIRKSSPFVYHSFLLSIYLTNDNPKHFLFFARRNFRDKIMQGINLSGTTANNA